MAAGNAIETGVGNVLICSSQGFRVQLKNGLQKQFVIPILEQEAVDGSGAGPVTDMQQQQQAGVPIRGSTREVTRSRLGPAIVRLEYLGLNE